MGCFGGIINYLLIPRSKLNNFVELIKSVVFAITVTWIALYNGYDCIPTSEGISQATTRTVVHASLAVLGVDFVLTAMMFGN